MIALALGDALECATIQEDEASVVSRDQGVVLELPDGDARGRSRSTDEFRELGMCEPNRDLGSRTIGFAEVVCKLQQDVRDAR